jgi:hypothetical protein
MVFGIKSLHPRRYQGHRSRLMAAMRTRGRQKVMDVRLSHHPRRTTADQCDVGEVTIDILPDDILLCIFHVYTKGPHGRLEEWHTLVHVCRRWRILVFGSPRHLNVRLHCYITTPVMKKLDIWPAIPIVVYCWYLGKRKLGNVIAALKHNDRVCKIEFRDKWRLEEVVSVMQVPFPALADLELVLIDSEMLEEVTVIPDSFLGGSAPSLQRLHLERISFPGLLKLLLSATDLVSLQLRDLPHSSYISPDTMVTCLSTLVRLKLFTLEFESPQSRQGQESRHLPPPTPTLLPALTLLRFKGSHEYAEDLMAQIYAPLLGRLLITSFNETVPNIPHVSQFINRMPKFQDPDDARVTFSEDDVRITIRTNGHERLVLGILWDESVGQLSSLARLCRSFLPTLAMVERLYIDDDETLRPSHWPQGIRHSHWLELLHLFTGAKNLYLSKDLTPRISPVLQQLVGERATEVLPALQNLFFNEYLQRRYVRDSIEMFVVGRELSGHPITVSSWFK